jgi:hypothetical protein
MERRSEEGFPYRVPEAIKSTDPFVFQMVSNSARSFSDDSVLRSQTAKPLGMIGAPCVEGGEPAAETGKLIRRQLSNSFDDFLERYVTAV